MTNDENGRQPPFVFRGYPALLVSQAAAVAGQQCPFLWPFTLRVIQWFRPRACVTSSAPSFPPARHPARLAPPCATCSTPCPRLARHPEHPAPRVMKRDLPAPCVSSRAPNPACHGARLSRALRVIQSAHPACHGARLARALRVIRSTQPRVSLSTPCPAPCVSSGAPSPARHGACLARALRVIQSAQSYWPEVKHIEREGSPVGLGGRVRNASERQRVSGGDPSRSLTAAQGDEG